MAETVICVAEKPSLAAAIAGFLSPSNEYTTRAGGATPVHEFQGRFKNRAAHFRVTSVKGHVFNLDFTEEHQSWDRPPRELFGAGTIKKPSSGAVVQHIRHEAAGGDHLVLFLDCDREGENICFEVMHVALPELKRAAVGRQRVHRAFFSAVSAASIAAAMASLREPNEHEADAMPDEIAIEGEVLSMTKRFPGNPRLLEFGDDFLSCLKPRAAGKENTGTVIAAPKKKKK